jgi:hypothetical protein
LPAPLLPYGAGRPVVLAFSEFFRVTMRWAAFAALSLLVIASNANARAFHGGDCSKFPFSGGALFPGQKAKPLTYRDPDTGITFHVAGDGRHLSAVDQDGKLLWAKDPFKDAHLCPYRYARPIIVVIGAANALGPNEHYAGKPPSVKEANAIIADWTKRKSRFIRIYFDSSQFGAVDIDNGEFFPEGQN